MLSSIPGVCKHSLDFQPKDSGVVSAGVNCSYAGFRSVPLKHMIAEDPESRGARVISDDGI
jgi:hypothetical protein